MEAVAAGEGLSMNDGSDLELAPLRSLSPPLLSIHISLHWALGPAKQPSARCSHFAKTEAQ
jgi:hypothetical protein